MATTSFYLDCRRKPEGVHSLRISVCHHTKTASYPLGVRIRKDQWNSVTHTIVNHPEAKYWNNFIYRRKVAVDTLILKLEDEDSRKLTSMTAVELRDYLSSLLQPTVKPRVKRKRENSSSSFLKWFDRYTARKSGRTREIYVATRKRLVSWLGERSLARVRFEDIKVSWLEDFEDFLSKTAGANANAIHFRNIRAVVNYAISNEVTTYYAFRRFKIKSKVTRKRNFDVDTLRRIFDYRCSDEWQQRCLDYFKLSFMLIGINVVDLYGVSEVKHGRIEYVRSKTHRTYSIKIEPEAMCIIERYSGGKRLLNFTDGYKNYRYFYNALCKGFKAIKEQLGLDDFTTYWARHSWATIAASLDIPKETIAAGLGHGGNTVTDIYIDYDMRKVDDANRKVLDYVLYGRRPSPFTP